MYASSSPPFKFIRGFSPSIEIGSFHLLNAATLSWLLLKDFLAVTHRLPSHPHRVSILSTLTRYPIHFTLHNPIRVLIVFHPFLLVLFNNIDWTTGRFARDFKPLSNSWHFKGPCYCCIHLKALRLLELFRLYDELGHLPSTSHLVNQILGTFGIVIGT